MKLSQLIFSRVCNAGALTALLLLAAAAGNAQQPAGSGAPTPAGASSDLKDANLIEVFLNEAKLLSVDRPIESYTVTPENIVKIDKVEGSLNQLQLVGLASGHAVLKISSEGRSFVYSIAVSTAPERLYINIPESKRIEFPYTVDSTSVSSKDIIRVQQPDTDDKVLLIEALHPGRTTLTVFVKDQIYRYFISTFENRGADILEIQNDFTAKGYRSLAVSFDNDEAVLTGTVPTQEELDDAVRIVKQFTPYVVVHANLGEPEGGYSDNSEYEQLVINNIKRISGVQNITIRVKYATPTVTETTVFNTQTGDFVNPGSTTTPQGGVIRNAGFEPPAAGENNGGDELEARPRKNTTTTVSETRDRSIPEKVFIYGDLEDDLQEARVLRVARTFCPFIVNFMTIKDPIQLRVMLRFLQVNQIKVRNTGVDWGPAGPALSIGVVAGGPTFGIGTVNPILSAFSGIFTQGVGIATGAIDESTSTNLIVGTMHLFATTNAAKETRESSVFLQNSQPGWYSEGEVQYYVSGSTVTASSPPIETVISSPLFYGVNMELTPLNVDKAGGTAPEGQKILPLAAGVSQGTATYTLETSTSPEASKIGMVPGSIQAGGKAPFIDETTKFVDENGMIGLNISTQLSIPNGTPQKVTFGQNGDQFITLPDFFLRTTRTRASLRDGQSITLTGLIDRTVSRNIQSVPFFEKIPIFSALFKFDQDTEQNNEIYIMVSPHIIRAREDDNDRLMKPKYSEMKDLTSEAGMIPQIKPVVLTKEMDIRPEKDMKDVKGMAPMPPSPAPQAPAGSPAPTPVTPNAPSTPGNDAQPATHPAPQALSLPDEGAQPSVVQNHSSVDTSEDAGQTVATTVRPKAKVPTSNSATLP